MCFDKDSSLLAWTLSYTIATYLFYRNRGVDRWNAGFIICFATIQLLEAGIWSTQERSTKGDHSKEINDMLTRIVLLVLVCQPFFQTYLGYKYTKSTMLGILSFILLGVIIWSLFRISKSKPGDFSSAPGPNGHLVWTDAQSPNNFLGGSNNYTSKIVPVLYFSGLLSPLLFMAYHGVGMKAIMLLAIGLGTAVYSLCYAGPKEFSSYWCFAAVLYSIAALFV